MLKKIFVYIMVFALVFANVTAIACAAGPSLPTFVTVGDGPLEASITHEYWNEEHGVMVRKGSTTTYYQGYYVEEALTVDEEDYVIEYDGNTYEVTGVFLDEVAYSEGGEVIENYDKRDWDNLEDNSFEFDGTDAWFSTGLLIRYELYDQGTTDEGTSGDNQGTTDEGTPGGNQGTIGEGTLGDDQGTTGEGTPGDDQGTTEEGTTDNHQDAVDEEQTEEPQKQPEANVEENDGATQEQEKVDNAKPETDVPATGDTGIANMVIIMMLSLGMTIGAYRKIKN